VTLKEYQSNPEKFNDAFKSAVSDSLAMNVGSDYIDVLSVNFSPTAHLRSTNVEVIYTIQHDKSSSNNTLREGVLSSLTTSSFCALLREKLGTKSTITVTETPSLSDIL
jgi:hypothetical protein